MKQFKVLQKEEVFAGLAFQVSRQRVSFPNGHIADIDFLALRKTVVMVPLSGAGSIYFVEQYRHAAGQVLLELPAGTTENNEPPAICAQRELREEIGMSAGDIKPIGEFFVAPGYSNEYMHVYLATELQPAPLPPDEGEFINVVQLSIDAALSRLDRSKFNDAKTIAALSLARPHLTQSRR